MNIRDVEVQLREKFIKLYKNDVGRGPNQTAIKVIRNWIVVEYKGVFTKLEINLLNADSNNEEIIRNMRHRLKKNVEHLYIEEVENYFSCEVVDLITELSTKNDTLYLLFILDMDIENDIENV